MKAEPGSTGCVLVVEGLVTTINKIYLVRLLLGRELSHYPATKKKKKRCPGTETIAQPYLERSASAPACILKFTQSFPF